MPVQSTFLAEDVGTVRTDDALHVVKSPHVGGEVGHLLPALRAGQVLQLGHVDLQSVYVEGGLGGELLITVGALPHIGWQAEHRGWSCPHFLGSFTGTALDSFRVWTRLRRC